VNVAAGTLALLLVGTAAFIIETIRLNRRYPRAQSRLPAEQEAHARVRRQLDQLTRQAHAEVARRVREHHRRR
jgi:hypothetical protein